MTSPARHGTLALFGSIPWCCVVPAALSLLSLGGTLAVRLAALTRLSLYFLPVAAFLLGRAFWLMYVRRQGSPRARRITWAAALLSVALWIWRFWPILG